MWHLMPTKTAARLSRRQPPGMTVPVKAGSSWVRLFPFRPPLPAASSKPFRGANGLGPRHPGGRPWPPKRAPADRCNQFTPRRKGPVVAHTPRAGLKGLKGRRESPTPEPLLPAFSRAYPRPGARGARFRESRKARFSDVFGRSRKRPSPARKGTFPGRPAAQYSPPDRRRAYPHISGHDTRFSAWFRFDGYPLLTGAASPLSFRSVRRG